MRKNGKFVRSENERNSNLELLRILCMIMLVLHHFVVHGGSIGMEGMSTNRIISLIILPLGKICFNCFIALSTWFLVKSTFKASRFIKVWIQVLFYNIIFLALTCMIGGVYADGITWKTWLGAFFPVTGNSHGYAAAYMAFYLTIPFLKMISDAVNKKQLILLISFLAITQLGAGLLGYVIGYTQPFASEILLFVLCYFISLYLQKYPLKYQNNGWVLIIFFLGLWLFTAFCRVWNAYSPEIWFPNFFANYATGSELSFVNIIAGYALFLAFNTIKMPTSKMVNTAATTMFGVLLFHDHNFFRPVLWKVILKTDTWYYISTSQFVFRMVIITIGIMTFGMAIDFLRQNLFEKWLIKSRPVLAISSFLDNCLVGTSNANDNAVTKRKEQHSISASKTELNGHALTQNHNLAKHFSVCVLVGIAVYWLINLLTRSSNIDAYFVTDHGDTAMDYFNMLSNLNNSDPWYANANYPAICFLFWKIMHRFLPVADFQDGFYLRGNMIAQLGYILFVLVCIVIIWEAIKWCAKGTQGEKILFACALLFSGPMFFLLERGNILLVVLAFSMIFLALYDSPKLFTRIIAYLCLAIAAAIKIYPAVFGLLVLSKKRYKEAGILIALGSTIFIAPFFVFDGLESISKMIEGFSAAADVQLGIGLGINFCINNFIQIVAAFCGRNLTSVPEWVSVVAVIFCLFLFVISKNEWQKLYALVLLCIWFPSFSYTYTLVLLFLPIISFMHRSERWQQGRFRIFYAIAFALMIIPYALPMATSLNNILGLDYVKFPLSWGAVIINVMLVLVAIMTTIDGIMDRCADAKQAKKTK